MPVVDPVSLLLAVDVDAAYLLVECRVQLLVEKTIHLEPSCHQRIHVLLLVVAQLDHLLERVFVLALKADRRIAQLFDVPVQLLLRADIDPRGLFECSDLFLVVPQLLVPAVSFCDVGGA